jgi:hypothetical protein
MLGHCAAPSRRDGLDELRLEAVAHPGFGDRVPGVCGLGLELASEQKTGSASHVGSSVSPIRAELRGRPAKRRFGRLMARDMKSLHRAWGHCLVDLDAFLTPIG